MRSGKEGGKLSSFRCLKATDNRFKEMGEERGMGGY